MDRAIINPEVNPMLADFINTVIRTYRESHSVLEERNMCYKETVKLEKFFNQRYKKYIDNHGIMIKIVKCDFKVDLPELMFTMADLNKIERDIFLEYTDKRGIDPFELSKDELSNLIYDVLINQIGFKREDLLDCWPHYILLIYTKEDLDSKILVDITKRQFEDCVVGEISEKNYVRLKLVKNNS